MKMTYLTPEMNLIGALNEDVIRTSDGFEIVEGKGDGDRVSINQLLGTGASGQS